MAEKEKKTVKRSAAKKAPTKHGTKKLITTQAEPAHDEKRVKGLAPLSTLFSESWALLKKSWIMYFKIAGVVIGLFLAALVIGAIIIVPLFFMSGGNAEQLFMRSTGVQIILVILLVLWVLAFIGATVIFQIISSIAFLLYLNNPDRDWSVRELFERSRPYFWQYFGSSLLVGFAVMGGMVFFFIPGLVIGLFFSFVAMAIVLENKSVMAALQRSYQIVKGQFWAILGRLLLIQVLSFFISQSLSSMQEDSPFVSLLIIIYSMVMGVYILVYTFVIYKQAAGAPQAGGRDSLTWIWILSILGWVCLLILFGFALFSGIPQPR